ncbi:hypothetical protein P9112_001557 [Eukaryota sp. TZLM1-RC]
MSDIQRQYINMGVEIMEGDLSSISANKLIAELPPFWKPEVTNDYGEMIRRRFGFYFPTEEVDNHIVRCDPQPSYPQPDVLSHFRTPP